MTIADMNLRLDEAPRRGEKVWAIALAVSVLCHLLLIYLLTFDLPWSNKGDEEQPVTVNLVQAAPVTPLMPEVKAPEVKPLLQPKPETKPEAKPEPKVEPKAEPKAEPKEAPKPEAKPAAPPPKPVTPKPEPAKLPPKPNLAPDKLAEKSSPAGAPNDQEKAENARKALDPATRTISDLILGQVSQLWSPPPQLRGRHANIHFVIDLLPNGMFGPPFAADGPWDPARALAGLDQIPANDPRYTALLNFYRTLREIQPIQLPPQFASQNVRSIPVWFMLDDMP